MSRMLGDIGDDEPNEVELIEDTADWLDRTELDQLKRSLTNITPSPEQINRIEQLRASAKEFAEDLLNFTDSGRERSLAKTHLEETVMWAVKSIVLNERNQ